MCEINLNNNNFRQFLPIGWTIPSTGWGLFISTVSSGNFTSRVNVTKRGNQLKSDDLAEPYVCNTCFLCDTCTLILIYFRIGSGKESRRI